MQNNRAFGRSIHAYLGRSSIVIHIHDTHKIFTRGPELCDVEYVDHHADVLRTLYGP